ncbi:MAG: GNAT family N-acetyltransferase [Anaerolineae bacterium]|nr:GNAT family N-acetyltransferase [Anaerolineae bacterium]
MTIRYTDSLSGITPVQLRGFFVGWPNPPSPETHLRILQGSAFIWLAVDDTSGRVVGFVNAISDGLHAAFIPNLEVLPEYQGRGIGTGLMQRMIATCRHLYALDLVCDAALQPFYERLGMRAVTGIALRHYDRQAGG